MKKILFFITLMVQSLGIFADDIYISDFSIKKGETKTLDIIVVNEADVSGKALGCAIKLPEGLAFEGTDASYTTTSRLKSFSMQQNGINKNGDLKFNVMSAVFDAGEGAMWTFKVTASDEFEGGEITVTTKNVGGNNKIAESKTKVTLESSAPERTDPMYINDFSIKQGGIAEVEIILNNETAISGKALGCAIKLPDGLSYEGTNASCTVTDRLVSSSMQQNGINKNGDLKFNIMSAVVEAGKGTIFTFKVKASDDFESGTLVLSSINVGGTLIKDPINVTVTGTPGTGVDSAIVNIENNAVVYNIAGQRVNANAKGIIIKNGKKFIAQ